MLIGIAMEQTERACGVSAQQVEQIGRAFRDAQQDGVDARKLPAEIANRSRLVRLEINELASETLFSFKRHGHMWAVHEPRGQTM